MKNKILLVFFLPLTFICRAQHKEFYKTTINATILLYKKTNGHLKAHGTAFILYNYDETSDEAILVTCEHVTHHDTLIAAIPAVDSLKNALIKNKQSTLTFASRNGMQTVGFDGNNLLFSIPVEPGNNYFTHSNLDLATIFCNIPSTLTNKRNQLVCLTNMKSLPKSCMSLKNDFYAGQEIIFAGFPAGIGTQNGFFDSNMYRDMKTNPLFRKGIISWTSENADMFLVDGLSYGGNSGSPVFSIPEGNTEGKFLGMVVGHLNDEVEINNMNADTLKKDIQSPRSYINVNNGLAQCIPAYLIYDFACQAGKNRAKLVAQKKERAYSPISSR